MDCELFPGRHYVLVLFFEQLLRSIPSNTIVLIVYRCTLVFSERLNESLWTLDQNTYVYPTCTD
jgi:hypothetical protein